MTEHKVRIKEQKLYDKLKIEAKKQHRTPTAEANIRLEQSFKEVK